MKALVSVRKTKARSKRKAKAVYMYFRTKEVAADFIKRASKLGFTVKIYTNF